MMRKVKLGGGMVESYRDICKQGLAKEAGGTGGVDRGERGGSESGNWRGL